MVIAVAVDRRQREQREDRQRDDEVGRVRRRAVPPREEPVERDRDRADGYLQREQHDRTGRRQGRRAVAAQPRPAGCAEDEEAGHHRHDAVEPLDEVGVDRQRRDQLIRAERPLGLTGQARSGRRRVDAERDQRQRECRRHRRKPPKAEPVWASNHWLVVGSRAIYACLHWAGCHAFCSVTAGVFGFK